MYLVAIIDVGSRFIGGWDISNGIEGGWVVETLEQAIARHGAPQIIDSDQGSQFTSAECIGYISSLKIVKISTDGKRRATDNACIERFFQTIKYDKIYLHFPDNGHRLFTPCKEFITFYNDRRGHSSRGYVPPGHRDQQAT